jgi:hypothetical protein
MLSDTRDPVSTHARMAFLGNGVAWFSSAGCGSAGLRTTVSKNTGAIVLHSPHEANIAFEEGRIERAVFVTRNPVARFIWAWVAREPDATFEEIVGQCERDPGWEIAFAPQSRIWGLVSEKLRAESMFVDLNHADSVWNSIFPHMPGRFAVEVTGRPALVSRRVAELDKAGKKIWIQQFYAEDFHALFPDLD